MWLGAGSKGSIHVKGAQLLPDQLSSFVRQRLGKQLGNVLRSAQTTQESEELDEDSLPRRPQVGTANGLVVGMRE